MPTLTAPVKLTAFAGLLAVTFGAAFGLGSVVDPTDDTPRPAMHGTTTSGGGTDGGAAHRGHPEGTGAEPAPGEPPAGAPATTEPRR